MGRRNSRCAFAVLMCLVCIGGIPRRTRGEEGIGEGASGGPVTVSVPGGSCSGLILARDTFANSYNFSASLVTYSPTGPDDTCDPSTDIRVSTPYLEAADTRGEDGLVLLLTPFQKAECSVGPLIPQVSVATAEGYFFYSEYSTPATLIDLKNDTSSPESGHICDFGAVHIEVHNSCSGAAFVTIHTSLEDASEAGCALFMQVVEAQGVEMILGSAASVVVLLALCSCCCFCPLGCSKSGCFGCVGNVYGCCMPTESYEEKSRQVVLLNAGGHSRGYFVNLIVAGVIWVQTEIFTPEFDMPTGVNEPDVIGSLVFVSQTDLVSSGQFSGLVKWIRIVLASCWIGYFTYASFLVNSTPRDSSKFGWTMAFSVFMLITLNLLYLIVLASYFADWSYIVNPVENGYILGAMLLHLSLADLFFLRYAIFPSRFGQRKPTGTVLMYTPTDRNLWQRMWARVKEALFEDRTFSYHPFLLSVIVAAFHILIFSYLSALQRLASLSDCLEDIEACVVDHLPTVAGIDVSFLISLVKPSNETGLTNTVETLQAVQVTTQDLVETLSPQLAFVCSPDIMGTLAQLQGFALSGTNVTVEAASALSAAEVLAPLCVFDLSNAVGNLTGSVGSLAQSVAPQLNGTDSQSPSDLSAYITQASNAYLFAVEQFDNAVEYLQLFSTSFRVSAFIGYTVGLIVGIYALFNTLASYKRMVKLIIRQAALVNILGPEAAAEAWHEPIVEEIQGADMKRSAYFLGMVVSTAYIQLQVFGAVFTVIGSGIGYRPFWTDVVSQFWGLLFAIALVLFLNMFVVFGYVGNAYAEPQRVKKFRGWVAFYIIISFAQLTTGLLLALMRIAKLLISSLIAMNRLDVNLFTVLRSMDSGYNSFLGMVAMVQAMRRKELRGWKLVKHAIRGQKFHSYKTRLQTQPEDLESSDSSKTGGWMRRISRRTSNVKKAEPMHPGPGDASARPGPVIDEAAPLYGSVPVALPSRSTGPDQ